MNLAVAVVTWQRPQCLNTCLTSIAATMPDFRTGYVIANHPASLDGVELGRFLPIPTGRPPEHAGNLAQSWNLAMTWAFHNPQTEWLLCVQDDMVLRDGWIELIQNGPPRDLYSAPAGDQAFLMNRRVLREVGWFDERFTTIGYHEFDWQARACRAMPHDRLCIEDRHGWTLNPMGLSHYWERTTPDHGRYDDRWQRQNYEWMHEKWQCNLLEVLPDRVPEPQCLEIEWYPWFPR